MHQKGNKIKRGSEQRKVHRDLTIITNDKNFSLFIYLFTYLLVRVTVKYSILPLFLYSLVFFVVFLYVFSNFLLFFFLFWLFYYCYFFLFFRFLLTPHPAVRTSYPAPRSRVFGTPTSQCFRALLEIFLLLTDKVGLCREGKRKRCRFSELDWYETTGTWMSHLDPIAFVDFVLRGQPSFQSDSVSGTEGYTRVFFVSFLFFVFFWFLLFLLLFTR